MTDWINANAGILSLGFSLVVAASTVVYAVLTAKLVNETRRMRRVQTEPQLSIHSESSDFGLSFMNLVIQNVGAGAAHDVHLSLDRDFEWMTGKLLSKRGIFTYPIPYLAPGQRISTFLLNILDHVQGDNRSLEHLGFGIKAAYRNAAGDLFENSFIIHFEYLEELVGIGEPPLVSIARHLKKIENDITGIASGHRRVRAVVYTVQDEQAEQERILRKHEERARQRGEPAT